MKALYETISGLLNIYTDPELMDDADKEDTKLALEALGFILSAPLYACADENLAMKIATAIIEYIEGEQENAYKQDVQAEDAEANEYMREAIQVGTEISEGLKQHVEGNDNES